MPPKRKSTPLPDERIELTLTNEGQTFYRYVWREWLAEELERINCRLADETTDQQFTQEVDRLASADPAVRSSIAMCALGTTDGLEAVRYVEDAELSALITPYTVAIPPAFVERFDALYRRECNILSDDEISSSFLEPQSGGHSILLADEMSGTQALRIATVHGRGHEIHIFEPVAQTRYVYARAAVDLADIDTAVRVAFHTWGATG